MASGVRELLLIGVTSAIGAGAVLNSPKEPSSELSPSAPRFMSQIKTTPEENRKHPEEEISQLEKLLRRAQENKVSSDLDVLQYEVPLSP